MEQEARRLQHQKVSRSLVKAGVPSINELIEGIPVTRRVKGSVYVFHKVGNQRYYQQLTEGTP